MTFAIITLIFLVVLILASGLFMAATPYLMPRNECFAVTVPSASANDPRLTGLKRRYALIMVVVTLLTGITCAALTLPLFAGGDDALENAAVGIICFAIMVPLIAGFALMLHFRSRVREVKREAGWHAQASERVAVVGEEDVPRGISLWWNLLYVVVILATVVLGLLLYPSMPDPIPMHGDFAGNVDTWAGKSFATVFGLPLAIEGFLGLVMFLCHLAMNKAKKSTDSGAPATSALAYGMFLRAQSVFLLVVGVSISVIIGFGFMLSSAQLITLGNMGAVALIAGVIVVIGAIALSVVFGQNGSRLFARMNGSEVLLTDDDEHWALGVFYVNRDDASVFVPKRFGIGWTLNFARAGSWALIVGFVVLCVALVVVSVAIVQ